MNNYVRYSSLSQHRYEELCKNSWTEQDIYWALENLNKILPSMYMSQDWLAEFVGTTRPTVNKALKKLQKQGFITIKHRGYLRTCIYTINYIKEVSQDIVDFLRNNKTLQSVKSYTIRRVMSFSSSSVPAKKKKNNSSFTKTDYAEAWWHYIHGHTPENYHQTALSDAEFYSVIS